jgi:hypothetical protein
MLAHMEVYNMLNGRGHSIATEAYACCLNIYKTSYQSKKIASSSYLDSCTTSPSATIKVG